MANDPVTLTSERAQRQVRRQHPRHPGRQPETQHAADGAADGHGYEPDRRTYRRVLPRRHHIGGQSPRRRIWPGPTFRSQRSSTQVAQST